MGYSILHGLARSCRNYNLGSLRDSHVDTRRLCRYQAVPIARPLHDPDLQLGCCSDRPSSYKVDPQEVWNKHVGLAYTLSCIMSTSKILDPSLNSIDATTKCNINCNQSDQPNHSD